MRKEKAFLLLQLLGVIGIVSASIASINELGPQFDGLNMLAEETVMAYALTKVLFFVEIGLIIYSLYMLIKDFNSFNCKIGAFALLIACISIILDGGNILLLTACLYDSLLILVFSRLQLNKEV